MIQQIALELSFPILFLIKPAVKHKLPASFVQKMYF